MPDISMSSCGEEGRRPKTACENSALPNLSAALLHGLQEIAVGLGKVSAPVRSHLLSGDSQDCLRYRVSG